MWKVEEAFDMKPPVFKTKVEVAFQEVAGVYGKALPDASSPSQSAAEPVSAIQVASLLPNVTVPVESIDSAGIEDVAKVDADDVARKKLPLMLRNDHWSFVSDPSEIAT
jgi:hypothetical protein